MLVFIASLALVFALSLEAAAQSEIQFNALYNCPDSSMYNFKVLAAPTNKIVRSHTTAVPNLI